MGRHKPGKPHRPRPVQIHDHGKGFDHDDRVYGGNPVDGGLLAELMGASLDGCTTCQDILITLTTQDAATTTRLVELACVAVQTVLGGLPPNLTGDAADDGVTAPAFQLLARTGIDGENDEMWRTCTQMIPEQRREAVNTALNLLSGLL